MRERLELVRQPGDPLPVHPGSRDRGNDRRDLGRDRCPTGYPARRPDCRRGGHPVPGLCRLPLGAPSGVPARTALWADRALACSTALGGLRGDGLPRPIGHRARRSVRPGERPCHPVRPGLERHLVAPLGRGTSPGRVGAGDRSRPARAGYRGRGEAAGGQHDHRRGPGRRRTSPGGGGAAGRRHRRGRRPGFPQRRRG